VTPSAGTLWAQAKMLAAPHKMLEDATLVVEQMVEKAKLPLSPVRMCCGCPWSMASACSCNNTSSR
jgi:hypothetical protein